MLCYGKAMGQQQGLLLALMLTLAGHVTLGKSLYPAGRQGPVKSRGRERMRYF